MSQAPLDAVLSRLRPIAPQAARQAGAALEAALDGTHRSCWPEIAWRASRLTNTGFPVEMSWSSRDAAVRWTAETAGPETPESERLGSALAVLRALGVDMDVPDWLVPQPGQELRFGSWISGRHDRLRDRYKLYVEMAGVELPGELLRSPILETVPRRTVWRMAGVDTGTGMMELYGKLAKPEIWEVERLLIRGGLAAGPVIELAAQLTGSACDEVLLPGTCGLSLAILDGHLVAAGFLVHSSPLLGGDKSVARKLRQVAGHHDWDLEIYDALLGSGEPEHPGRHGLIGFGVAADGSPWMQIGLRP
jgi:hypothetical protein